MPNGASVSFDYVEADVVRVDVQDRDPNCEDRAARLTHADVMMSVDAVRDESHRVELAERLRSRLKAFRDGPPYFGWRSFAAGGQRLSRHRFPSRRRWQ
jgi:hypothetical protein